MDQFGEEPMLEIPNNEDSSDDSGGEDNLDEDHREVFEVDINGQIIQFPDHHNTDHSMIIEECLAGINGRKNILLECPSDKTRRMATITALLFHQQHYEMQDQNQLQQVPDRRPPPSPPAHRQKIYYAAKSFQELQEVINELKKFKNTGYLQNIVMAVLAYPSQLCRQCHDVLLCSLPGISDNGNGGYRIIEEDGTVRDIMHMKKKGKRESFCPYRYNREIVDQANFILCTQEFIISSAVRANANVNLTDAIVIFDDAGNIEISCYAEASASMKTTQLNLAAQCFSSVAESFHEVNGRRRSEELQVVAQNLSRLSDSLMLFETAITFQSRGRNTASPEKLVEILKSRGFSSDEIHNYIGHLRSTLNFLEEEEDVKNCVKDRRIETLHVLSIQKFLYSIRNVYNSILTNNLKDFGLQVETYTPRPRGAQTIITFHISYANLVAILEPVMNQTSSVIVSSACLPPVNIFLEQLSPNIIFEENVIIPEPSNTHCFFAYSSVGPNGVPFQLDYQNKERSTVHNEAGEAILNVIHTIPNGVIVFFPSISALEDKVNAWQNEDNRSSSIWTDMKQVKHVFCELEFMKIEDAKRQLEVFRGKCTNPDGNRNGAILFAPHRHNVSKIMDFRPGEVRGIISLGIPFHSIKAFDIVTKKAYNDTTGRNANLWYNGEAFHNQNSKFAHCVRKDQGWVVGLIFDNRMEKKVEARNAETLLPTWMQNEWKKFRDFTKLIKKLQNFVKENLN